MKLLTKHDMSYLVDNPIYEFHTRLIIIPNKYTQLHRPPQ